MTERSRDDAEVVHIAVPMLRLGSFTVPLTGVPMIANFLLQASGRMWRAMALGACRLGLVLAPTVVALSSVLDLLGVQLAQPATDVITTLVALPMARSCLRERRRERQVSDTGRLRLPSCVEESPPAPFSPHAQED